MFVIPCLKAVNTVLPQSTQENPQNGQFLNQTVQHLGSSNKTRYKAVHLAGNNTISSTFLSVAHEIVEASMRHTWVLYKLSVH